MRLAITMIVGDFAIRTLFEATADAHPDAQSQPARTGDLAPRLATRRHLARRGHAVTLWTAAPHHYYRPARETREGVTIVETPSWAPLAWADDGWGPLDVAYRLLRVVLEPFDLCYAFAHPPNVAWPAWVARWVRGRRLIYDWCDWYEGGIFPKRAALRREGLAAEDEPPLQA